MVLGEVWCNLLNIKMGGKIWADWADLGGPEVRVYFCGGWFVLGIVVIRNVVLLA